MTFEEIADALGATVQGDRAAADCPICNYRPQCLVVYRDEGGTYGYNLRCFGAGCHPAPILRAIGANGVAPSPVAASDAPRAAMTPAERRADLTHQQLRFRERKSKQFDRALRLWQSLPTLNDAKSVKVGRDYLLSCGLVWDEDLRSSIRFGCLHKSMPEYHWFRIPNMRMDMYFIITCAFRNVFRDNDDFIGAHVTFLAPWAGKVGRRTIGLIGTGAVKLCGSETPTRLLIGEGLETCLTARQLGYGDVWMLGSGDALGRFPLLTPVKELQVLREHDETNEVNAAIVAARYKRDRRRVTYRLPREGFNDLNDYLRGKHNG